MVIPMCIILKEKQEIETCQKGPFPVFCGIFFRTLHSNRVIEHFLQVFKSNHKSNKNSNKKL